MRSCTATILTACAAVFLSNALSAQPPPYEVRTFAADPVPDIYDPTAPAATSENTVKEPWICSYCGYSTGGTMDVLDADTNTFPDGDNDNDGIPDEADGQCPDPWGTGHAATDLVRAPLQQRFFDFRWLPGGLDLIRGLPYRPGDWDTSLGGGAVTVAGSRVRFAFRFDDTGDPAPGLDSTTTQIRAMLMPPGIARPTARYYEMTWSPQDDANTSTGTSLWGDDPSLAIQSGDLRIGVHPWRAVDGDTYEIRAFHDGSGADPTIEVWSMANGLEYAGDPPLGADIWCYSGAVRLNIAASVMPYDAVAAAAAGVPVQIWAYQFKIANNCRTLPAPEWRNTGNTTGWLTTPEAGLPTDVPMYYWPVSSKGGVDGVDDSDLYRETFDSVGLTYTDVLLTSTTAETQFRLRPGETGTGMVAMLWRNDAGDPWSYDEDSVPEPTVPDPGDAWPANTAHENGVQPIAARFFSSRVEAVSGVVTLPAGAPGGATDVSVDLEVRNRGVGDIVRCPKHVPHQGGRGTGGVDPYVDPLWRAAAGQFTAPAPGGDPPGILTHDPASVTPAVPLRTVGCGAAHVVGTGTACRCGRTHSTATASTMHCNYCGTRLVGNAAGNEAIDIEQTEISVDVASVGANATHAAVADLARPDAIYSMTGEAIRGTKNGVRAPAQATGAGLDSVLAPLFINVPMFQRPSYEPTAAATAHESGTDAPYQGAIVAYGRSDVNSRWYENSVDGDHSPFHFDFGALGLPDPVSHDEALFDGNGAWDMYYLCPDCGNKHPAMAMAAGGTLAYEYTDEYPLTTPETDLECSYGRTVGNTAGNDLAVECPGHQICIACGTAWEMVGEGQTSEEQDAMMLTFCPYEGTDLIAAGTPFTQTQQARFTHDYLTAEEYDPLLIIASVERKTRLVAGQPSVDLGRVAPGNTDANDYPVEVSALGTSRGGSQGNYTVTDAQMAAHNVTAWPAVPETSLTIDPGATGQTMGLFRDDVTLAPEQNSAHRLFRSVPISEDRLIAMTPAMDLSATPATEIWAEYMTAPAKGGAGGSPATALYRAGTWGEGDPAGAAPLPNGLGAGSYSGTSATFVDTDGDGYLGFLDRSIGMVATTTAATPFDATEDYALEPVIPVNLRVRVVESPLPFNDPDASDGSPTVLLLDQNDDEYHDGLEVLWESNRVAAGGMPPADAAVNIREGVTGLTGDRLTRSFPWGADVAVTAETGAGTVNGGPDAYIDPADNRKWALWHRLGPTDIGVSSTLWSSRATDDLVSPFGAAADTNYIFDSSLDKSWVRGFIDPTTAAPANHWSFWNSGKRGRWEIHYSPSYDPRDPMTVDDLILPVTNGLPASTRQDYVQTAMQVGNRYIRKPSKSPFAYIKDPSPTLNQLPGGTEYLTVVFSGYVTHERNADICRVNFNLSLLDDPTANYGKFDSFRITGAGGGEELRSDGVRQSFASRHLDWITTVRPHNFNFGEDMIVAPDLNLDPRIYVHLVFPGTPPGNHEIYELTWTNGRYRRSKGTYQLGGVELDRIGAGTFAANIIPVTPRSGRPLEVEVDPASGIVRFSAPLFNSTDYADPATFFNSGDFPGLIDVQVWADYTPYIYRWCRNDANDDSPSGFWDYGGPDLNAGDGVALGRFKIFWRRSHGSSGAPHFGRTSFMQAEGCWAIQVLQPPISTVTSVTDITTGAAVTPAGTDLNAGILGMWFQTDGHVFEVVYTPTGAAGPVTEYHRVSGLGDERRVNLDSVYSEGPLMVKREWYAVPGIADANGVTSTQLMTRYWLFWTSPRSWFDPAAGAFRRSREVYYATLVPEYGTEIPHMDVASR